MSTLLLNSVDESESDEDIEIKKITYNNNSIDVDEIISDSITTTKVGSEEVIEEDETGHIDETRGDEGVMEGVFISMGLDDTEGLEDNISSDDSDDDGIILNITRSNIASPRRSTYGYDSIARSTSKYAKPISNVDKDSVTVVLNAGDDEEIKVPSIINDELDALRFRHHRTAFDVNIDTLEVHPWRSAGVDLSDFFNYGFDEKSWEIYSESQLKHRAALGMGPYHITHNTTTTTTTAAAELEQKKIEVDTINIENSVNVTSDVTSSSVNNNLSQPTNTVPSSILKPIVSSNVSNYMPQPVLSSPYEHQINKFEIASIPVPQPPIPIPIPKPPQQPPSFPGYFPGQMQGFPLGMNPQQMMMMQQQQQMMMMQQYGVQGMGGGDEHYGMNHPPQHFQGHGRGGRGGREVRGGRGGRGDNSGRGQNQINDDQEQGGHYGPPPSGGQNFPPLDSHNQNDQSEERNNDSFGRKDLNKDNRRNEIKRTDDTRDRRSRSRDNNRDSRDSRDSRDNDRRYNDRDRYRNDRNYDRGREKDRRR